MCQRVTDKPICEEVEEFISDFTQMNKYNFYK